MENITIVSMDNELAKHVAKQLSKKLNVEFLDAGYELEKVLLRDAKLSVFDETTATKEKMLIALLTKQSNSVVAIENEMFLSNENYKQCKGITVLLEINNKEEMLENLQNLIKKHCKISTKETRVEKIITLLKG